MRSLKLICFFAALCGWLAWDAPAQTYIEFEFDGQKIEARPVKFQDAYIEIAPRGGGQIQKVPWGHLSQATLRRLENIRPYNEFARHFLDPPPQSPPTASNRVQITIKPVERMTRYQSGSLFSSPVTWLVFLLFYAANIYAGYEIAMFRQRNKVSGAGLSAALPVIGPIVLLCMPTYEAPVAEDETAAEGAEGAETAATTSETEEAAAQTEQAAPAAAGPQETVYLRGQTTFNRRFFETKMAGFLKVVPGEAEKDMVLVVASSRGTYVGTRFTRVSPNELTLHVVKGNASEDIIIPFGEITEVKIRHKDAKG
ncbi:MAG: hypothetical protein HZA90_21385 [Verrucomicrobia bacterium]|nr:hypothetical protein [Verrucomicrobiota bacterium]